MVFSSDTCSMNFLKTPPIYKSMHGRVWSMCMWMSVCVHMCGSVHMRLWKKTWVKGILHRAEGTLPHLEPGAAAWKVVILRQNERLEGLVGLAAQLWIKSFQLSFPFLRKDTLQGWCEIKQQRSENVFGNVCPNIKGHHSPWLRNGKSNCYLQQHASQWNPLPAQLAFSKGRRDVDNFPESQCFLISQLFPKQQKSNPSFCFPK